MKRSALFIVLVCAACGGGSTGPAGPAPPPPPPGPPPPVAPGDVTVNIGDNVFNPNSVTIHAGRSVRWVNGGGAVHNSVGANNSWNSGNLGPSESFERSFPQTGSFGYECTLHPGMSGLVTVVP